MRQRQYLLDHGQTPHEAPNTFARLVAQEVRREMGDRRMSGRELGRVIDMSEKYARDRIADRYEFALNDIERFCDFIGVLPEVFIARVERAAEEVPTHLIATEDGYDRIYISDSVGGHDEDDSGPFIFSMDTDLSQADVDLAAKRGPKKADQPHAD
jgi:hypothetical protein